MKYIHIKSLDKYHPGYRDRTLQWAKIYFKMVQGDPDFELIDNEIDKWRFVAMILLELQAQKPLPNIDRYWIQKGFNLAVRPMHDTINALKSNIIHVTEDNFERYVDKIKSKTEIKSNNIMTDAEFDFLWKNYPGTSEQKGSKAKAKLKLQAKGFNHTYAECGKAFDYYKDNSDNVSKGYVKNMTTFVNGGFIQQTLDSMKESDIQDTYTYACPDGCKGDKKEVSDLNNLYSLCNVCNKKRIKEK